MSLLSNFLVSSIIKYLENQFLEHEPDLQQAFLREVDEFVKTVAKWIEEKLTNEEESHDEEESEDEIV